MSQSQFIQPASQTHPATQSRIDHNYERLKQMSLWQHVPDDALRALVAKAHLDLKPAHTILFTDGDRGDAVYFICSGTVEIYLTNALRATVVLEECGAGSFCGEVAVLHGGNRTAWGRVKHEMFALRVERDDLLAVLRDFPDLMFAMYTETARHLGRTSADIRRTTARNSEAVAERTTLVGKIARFCGSLSLLAYTGGFVALWLVVCAALHRNPVDGPGFNALTLLLALEAIMVTCIVLHSQYQEADRSRDRNEEWRQATSRSEKTILNLHEELHDLRAELNRQRTAPDRSAIQGATSHKEHPQP